MHLPIGVSNFRDLIENKDPNQKGYLYVDKTCFIKEIIYDLKPVIILIRPRRFGKTLNLSMLHHFFAAEVDGQLTKRLFDGLNIAKDLICMEHQGKYPVVFITFKDVKESNFTLCLENIRSIMASVYRHHRAVLGSANIPKDDLKYIEIILEEQGGRIQLQDSIKRLLELLTKHYKEKPLLLIDEYDTPIQEAYLNGYYDELIQFMRNLFSGGLKDNCFLKRAILTGILRVSKESLFSGLSNVEIYSVLDENYSKYFGFTEQEVNNLLIKANLPHSMSLTKEWYNGYNFGGTTIYNPWSIIKFIKENGDVDTHWINTSGNELMRELLINAELETQEKIGQLINGDTITEIVDEHIVFRDLKKNRAALWSLFLMSGYLKVLSSTFTEFGNLCELRIPNKEVEFLYKQIFREWLSGNRGIVWYQEFLSVLTVGNVKAFEIKLQNIIEEMASYHDTSKTTQEMFYQGLMLGILAGLKDTHEVRSNRESGKGRYDLLIMPKNLQGLGIIIEIKAIRKNQSKLEMEAKEALRQIKKSEYTTELKSRGIHNLCSIGIAFSGKVIKVATDYVLPKNWEKK